jgi:hypothetical protein
VCLTLICAIVFYCCGRDPIGAGPTTRDSGRRELIARIDGTTPARPLAQEPVVL